MWIMASILFRRCTIRYVQSFLDVEFSLLSVFSNSSVIIYTIRYVRVLLNFCNNKSLTDCMNGSGFDKEYIPFMNRYFIQYFKKSVFFNSFCKFVFADFFFKSMIEISTFFCIHYIPHFGFAILPFIF